MNHENIARRLRFNSVLTCFISAFSFIQASRSSLRRLWTSAASARPLALGEGGGLSGSVSDERTMTSSRTWAEREGVADFGFGTGGDFLWGFGFELTSLPGPADGLPVRLTTLVEEN